MKAPAFWLCNKIIIKSIFFLSPNLLINGGKYQSPTPISDSVLIWFRIDRTHWLYTILPFNSSSYFFSNSISIDFYNYFYRFCYDLYSIVTSSKYSVAFLFRSLTIWYSWYKFKYPSYSFGSNLRISCKSFEVILTYFGHTFSEGTFAKIFLLCLKLFDLFDLRNLFSTIDNCWFNLFFYILYLRLLVPSSLIVLFAKNH